MHERREVFNGLIKERKKLEGIIKTAEKRLEKAPEGSISIHKHGKGYQFFLRTDPKDKNGVYLPVSREKTAFEIIQKKYDARIIITAEKQLAVIDQFLKNYDPDSLKKVYASLSETRKKIVTPVELPDELYAESWQTAEYEHRIISGSAPAHFTNKGERVRSKSEVLIANALFQAGVPYHYERPIFLNNHLVYPDFTVLRLSDRKELLWEHFGLIDEKDYRNSAVAKIDSYEKSGIFPGEGLIITTETSSIPLNLASVKRVIKHYLL